DRKSTRLNSSHRTNSYAVLCLKKKSVGVLQHGHLDRQFRAGAQLLDELHDLQGRLEVLLVVGADDQDTQPRDGLDPHRQTRGDDGPGRQLGAALGLLACFFFNVAAPTEIYTLSLHDALPI